MPIGVRKDGHRRSVAPDQAALESSAAAVRLVEAAEVDGPLARDVSFARLVPRAARTRLARA
jgi:hypothetical protein